MEFLPGLMTFTASLEGFSSAVVKDQISKKPTQSVTISLSPILDPGTEMRLVMNWGRHHRDLDLYVTQIDRLKSNICTINNNKYSLLQKQENVEVGGIS